SKKHQQNTDILIAQLHAYEAYEYPYDVKFVEGIETPKTWWVGCKQEKNYIQMLSLKILSIIPHNVNCEHLFPVLGWFMSKHKTCLNVERLDKMARLHTYYISNGKSLLNYPVDDVDDDKFNEELTEEIDNIEEYEEEEEVIQPGENDIAGEGETFYKYFNVNNQDLCELLKIQIYLKLYDSPNIASSSDNNIDYAKNKAKKAAIKAQQEAETKKAKKKIEKPQDDDPEGTENPLGEAFKFLIPLQELSQKRIETHLLAFEIYIRKDKYLLALRSLMRHNIDKENSYLHKNIVLFNSKLSNNTKINETTTKVIEAEKSRILPDNRSIRHLLAGVEPLLIINPEKKQEVKDLLFKVYEDEYLNDRTLKNCILVYEAFKNTFESPKAKEFKKKCQEWFPILTYFKDS
ncbi:16818_t:CDS:10, partial [Entrophospora sp. SA101]